ncbi:MAG: Ada metal-binding domain-containing protein, partial [Planctomycetota bacterium]
GYVATRSSKIYHRTTCMHAKRMDASKAISFAQREDAEKTGRRPCKTCKP